MSETQPSEAPREQSEVLIRPEGIFDIPAAWRLRETMSRLPPNSQVTVDFSALKECHDFALAALLQAVASSGGPKLHARGLRQHQERLLRYLGMDPR